MILQLRLINLTFSLCIPVVWVACGVVFPLDGYRGAPLVDATTGGEADANDAGCGYLVPEPPAPSEDGPDGPEYVWGINVLEPSNDESTLPIKRYNLDGLCTCPETPACIAPVGQRIPCDLAGGIDNSGGAFVDILLRRTGIDRSNTAKLAEGSSTLAVYLRKYNGAPNDPDVEAMIVPVAGTPKRPMWDGTDIRSPNTYWLATQTPLISSIVTSEAYVRDGVLVMSFSGPVPIGDLVLKTISARIVATIAKDTMPAGNLIFRTQASEFIRSLSRLSNGPDGGIGICDGAALDAVRSTICNGRDLPSDPKDDGRDKPCTSLSFTARFSAQRVRFGEPQLAPPYNFDCGPTFKAECQ
jgi:hypothetical protein